MARPKVDPVVIDFSNISGSGDGTPISQLIRPRQTFSRVFRGSQVAGTWKELRIDRDVWLVYAYANGVGVFLTRTPTVPTAQVWSTTSACIAMLNGTTAAYWVGNESFNAGDSLWLDSTGGMGNADFCVVVFAFGPVQNGD